MSINANDILRTVVKFSGAGWSQIQNVYDFIATGTGSATEDDILDAIQDYLEAIYLNVNSVVSTDISFVEALVDVVEFLIDNWEKVQSVGQILDLPLFIPAAIDDPLPPATSALVRMGTMVPKHEGRKYIGGLTEAENQTDGNINAATVTLLSNLAQAVAYNSVPVPNSSLNIEYVVVDVDQDLYRYSDRTSAGAQWAYQRRRKKYVGI